jgi:outer membrane protein assembly factor BamD (BamD/ComL family)
MTLGTKASLGLGLCIGLLITAPTAAQNDIILRGDNKHISKCKILKLEIDKVTYMKGGKEQEILVSRIDGFRFGDLPETFTRGQSAENRNDYANAGKLFAECSAAAKDGPVKNSANFFAGRAFSLQAEADAAHANTAVAALESYLATSPNGYYMPEAQVRLAKARLAGGDAAGAETMLAGMVSTATSGRWPLRWVTHIQQTLGTAQFAQQKYAAARSSFQGVAGAADSAIGQNNRYQAELTAIKTNSLVMQGETFIGEKMLNEALSYFQNLSNSTAKGVKAAAQAGQGQILFLQGASDTSKLRQAQLALAKASTEPDTNDSTSAKALFFMGKVLTALGDKEKNALARAKTYFQSVTNHYPKTSWATKASAELDG